MKDRVVYSFVCPFCHDQADGVGKGVICRSPGCEKYGEDLTALGYDRLGLLRYHWREKNADMPTQQTAM